MSSATEVADQLIRVPEARAMIGCGERVVWELLAIGVLHRHKMHGRRMTFLSRREVEEYVEKIKRGEA